MESSVTSQIVLMNKLGIAIASDSSLTISRGDNRRTYGSAEKIFTVGPDHNVAVLHSGSVEFMKHPYEVLLTEWRKSITRPLPLLQDYSESFISWLSHRQDLFNQENQNRYQEDISEEYFLEVRRVILERLRSADIGSELWQEDSTLEFVLHILEEDLAWIESQDDLIGLSQGWAESRFTSLKDPFQKAIDYVFDDIPRSQAIDEKILEIAQKLLYKAINSDNDARLAFTGYGEKEIYPSHVWLDFKGVIADRPRFIQSSEKVDTDKDCFLRTHAQDEAIHTYIRGYHFSYLEKGKENLRENAEALLDGIRNKLSLELFLQVEAEVFAIRNESIENLGSSFVKNSDDRFVHPFVSTLSGLPSASLGKMAESLIELQILRQSSQAIQDTVGGVVDVAVITLGNGFQWYRHKTLDDLWKGV